MDYQAYRHRVWGCYTGKAVGGTLGMPFEGKPGTRKLTFYEPVPTEMLSNDDLDLQVINLEAVRRFGLPVNRYHLSDLWHHVQDSGPDEYGVARWNVSLNRLAPLSGFYCNKFKGGMGAAIRSELWACLAPGDPALAVRLAREDACTDHYDDGVDAIVFLTAVESAAFTEKDMMTLIETGLSFLPENGRLARGLRRAMACYRETGDIYEARERFLKDFGVQNWTDVTINLGLTLIAWLSSDGDFSKGICAAVGLGYDTDCTGATLGSIMGIIDPDSIGEDWLKPIGDTLVLCASVMGLHEPETIGEFSDLVAATAAEVLAYYRSPIQLTDIGDALAGIPAMHAPWTNDTHAADDMDCHHETLFAVSPLAMRLIYPEEVTVSPLTPTQYTLTLRNTCDRKMTGRAMLTLPEGWSVRPNAFHFELDTAQTMRVSLMITPGAAEKRRPRTNPLEVALEMDGVRTAAYTDLPLTIPWIRTNLDTGEEEIIEAHAVFQTVPEGHWRYRTAIKANMGMPVRLGAFSTRALIVRYNDEEVLRTDGSYYVPAYHRGRTCINLNNGRRNGGWNLAEIEVLPGEKGELFFGLARQHNCCEWLQGVEYSLKPWQK